MCANNIHSDICNASLKWSARINPHRSKESCKSACKNVDDIGLFLNALLRNEIVLTKDTFVRLVKYTSNTLPIPIGMG